MNMTVTPLGDRHKCGQTRRMDTDTISYIEKPRDYQIEAAFSHLVHAFSQWGFDRICQVPALLEQGERSHTQAIVPHDPTDEEGLKRYFYRAGGLIFLAYLLGSTDLHGENIIAQGDLPVIVDLETLLGGKTRRQSADWNVLRSHLVCSFARIGEKTADVSGFGGMDGENLPFSAEKIGTIYAHLPETRRGFEAAYRVALTHKEEISDLLDGFSACRFRQILRPTTAYAAIINFLQTLPEDRRLPTATALLERAYLRDIDPNRLEKCRKVADEEIRAVLAGQIPLFHIRGDGTNLLDEDQVVQADFLDLSPVDAAKQRLNELSDENLTRQAAILEQAIRAADPAPRSIPVISDCLAPGERIGNWITRQALPGGNWFELTPEGIFAPLGLGLYSGLAGIGCMYAALYRKTEKTAYLRQTEQICQQILAQIAPKSITATNETASLGSGISGIALALTHISHLTGQTAYATAAAELLTRLTPGYADGDYLNGVGALPVAYRRCGVTPAADMRSWLKDVLSQPVATTGVAHGAAGRALSLAALGKREQSEALIRWENQHFIPEEGNWQDLRDPKNPGFMSGWCSGAPGIGMARHAMDESHPDIAAAEAFLEKQIPSRRHSLCCGTAARLMAASRLGVTVDKLFFELAEAEKTGQLRLLQPASTPEVPISLMQGAAGVAYALAMYQDPLSGGMLL